MNTPTALDCVLAARCSELRDLRALQQMVGLVGAVTAFVHQLQGERGLSNLMLGHRDVESVQRVADQHRLTDEAHQAIQASLKALDTLRHAQGTHGTHGARLFSRLGVALQALQALPALRRHVGAGTFDIQQSTQAYSRLVGAWLSVVFEVADVAGDAQLTRLLVALFNLSHTKELVGQERALGSARFASGSIQDEARQQVQDLMDSQLRGLSAFRHFAPVSAQVQVDELQRRAQSDDRARLRRLLLQTGGPGLLSPELGSVWFDACTAHMNELRALEALLLADLRALCDDKCDALAQEVIELEQLCSAPPTGTPEQALMGLALAPAANWTAPRASRLNQQGLAPDGAMAPELARQVMELVQQQAERLQSVTAELEEARSSLQDRKVVERAKGVLMAQAGLSEDDAYQALRRRAMQQGQRLVDVAQALLRRTN